MHCLLPLEILGTVVEESKSSSFTATRTHKKLNTTGATAITRPLAARRQIIFLFFLSLCFTVHMAGAEARPNRSHVG